MTAAVEHLHTEQKLLEDLEVELAAALTENQRKLDVHASSTTALRVQQQARGLDNQHRLQARRC